jgi:hypothetical protein
MVLEHLDNLKSQILLLGGGNTVASVAIFSLLVVGIMLAVSSRSSRQQLMVKTADDIGRGAKGSKKGAGKRRGKYEGVEAGQDDGGDDEDDDDAVEVGDVLSPSYALEITLDLTPSKKAMKETSGADDANMIYLDISQQQQRSEVLQIINNK